MPGATSPGSGAAAARADDPAPAVSEAHAANNTDVLAGIDAAAVPRKAEPAGNTAVLPATAPPALEQQPNAPESGRPITAAAPGPDQPSEWQMSERTAEAAELLAGWGETGTSVAAAGTGEPEAATVEGSQAVWPRAMQRSGKAAAARAGLKQNRSAGAGPGSGGKVVRTPDTFSRLMAAGRSPSPPPAPPRLAA